MPSRAAADAPPAQIAAVLDKFGDAIAVLFDPPPVNHMLVAAHIQTPLDQARSLLGDIQTYRRAVPELVKADVVEERTDPPRRDPDRLIAWELEVPLWNLKGKLWLRSRGDRIDIDLVSGDLSPGRFSWSLTSEGARTLATLDASANVGSVSYVTRKLAGRNPLAAPAMTAAAAVVFVRAVGLEVEAYSGHGDGRRWPPSKTPSPPLGFADNELGAWQALLAPLAAARAPVIVARSRSDGRLDAVAAAWHITRAVPLVNARIHETARWLSLPGWRSITRESGPDAEHPIVWNVNSTFPFVDFDAHWAIAAGEPFSAQALDGDIAGALMTWRTVGDGPGTTDGLFVTYPRIEKTGYFPRRFVAAEPLLEHGLSVALTYVNSASLVRSLGE